MTEIEGGLREETCSLNLLGTLVKELLDAAALGAGLLHWCFASQGPPPNSAFCFHPLKDKVNLVPVFVMGEGTGLESFFLLSHGSLNFATYSLPQNNPSGSMTVPLPPSLGGRRD